MIESPLLSKSIHQRFLVVALFPLLLTITLLTLYTIDARRGDLSENLYPVSYTHLTLPTNREV